jgi:hypothetical protein
MKLIIVDQTENGTPGFDPIVAALEAQISRDFVPAWSVRVEIAALHYSRRERMTHSRDLTRSDAIVYVSASDSSRTDAVNYHKRAHNGAAVGFVHAGANWSPVLSHEVLELLVDPYVNLLVPAPHPQLSHEEQRDERRKMVLRPYEVCDPVAGSTYEIDGIAVSNFVTPRYFIYEPRETVHSTATNFLGVELAPFNVLPSGYCRYYDLKDRSWHRHPVKQGRGARVVRPDPDLTRALRRQWFLPDHGGLSHNCPSWGC